MGANISIFSHRNVGHRTRRRPKMLRESVFFTARRRPKMLRESVISTAASERASASSPCGHYSARICTLMGHTEESAGMSEADAEMEVSRVHWTEVDEEYCTALATSAGEESARATHAEGMRSEGGMTEAQRVKLYKENVEAMRRLQRDNPKSRFFKIDKVEEELGRKIAEGGQAAIHEVGPNLLMKYTDTDVYRLDLVRKVFKAGLSVRDLQKQWPLALLHKFALVNGGDGGLNPVLYGRLQGDGRFAFDMLRWWGDVRKLLDVRMRHNGNQRPPFMKADGNYHECCMLEMMRHIAHGMRIMHKEGIVHRDLKASNVLIESMAYFRKRKEELRMDPIRLEHDCLCNVTDYECSIGVVGTGYWRAPEILEAVKNRTVHTTLNLFTEEADVYSYAMTCYEILTGFTPFEDIEDEGVVSIDDVLEGKRPRLPKYLRTWMKELLIRCWDKDPLKRPTFDVIVRILTGILHTDLGCKSESDFFEFHKK